MESFGVLKKLLPVVRTISRSKAPRLPQQCLHNNFCTQISKDSPMSVYEPDYLDSLKPKFPQYASLNVAIKGYDFPVLESYQRYLHNIAEYLDIDVSDCYALPSHKTNVQRLKPNSTVVDAEYKLTMYERNIQMSNVDSPIYPVFLRIAQAALPEGVFLQVQEHSDECEERRYVPDRDLRELKAELERMGGSREERKKK